MSKKVLTIDPKIFISASYKKCPKCGKDSFGVLSIFDNHYVRRCRECFYPKGTEPSESYKLPKLNKKIIYLDQFVISEMMKAINKKIGKTEKVDEFFLKLFVKLEMLHRKQLIACPYSTFQQNESLLAKYYEPLKRMYKYFSGGLSFYDDQTIRRLEICNGFLKSLGEKKVSEIDFESISYGNKNAWLPKYSIDVDFPVEQSMIDDIKKSRENINTEITKVFNSWRTQNDKKFEFWEEKEALAFGDTISRLYINGIINLDLEKEPDVDLLYNYVMSESNVLIHSLTNYLTSEMNQEEKIFKVFEYLRSKQMTKLPFIKISSALWATIAHQAAHGGRKKPPNIGMNNDIKMVSTYLPFCDAMVVDNEMCDILSFPKTQSRVSEFNTKIFSKKCQKELFDYLDEIEANAPKDVLKVIEDVYGKDYLKPYLDMYEK